MKIPLYLLGLLNQRGPLHGYRLRQIVADEVADFANIKPPTIYYNLEKLEKLGYVTRRAEQPGRRPARAVFTLTDEGSAAYREMLGQALKSHTPLEFLTDAVLYFGQDAGFETIIEGLEQTEAELAEAMVEVEEHRDEVTHHLQGPAAVCAGAIFSHHLSHHRAELTWLRETIYTLRRMLKKYPNSAELTS